MLQIGTSRNRSPQIAWIWGLAATWRSTARVAEYVIDSGAPEFERVDLFSMLISVMDQVSGDPTDVGFFGTFRDIERANYLAHLIDQLRFHDFDK